MWTLDIENFDHDFSVEDSELFRAEIMAELLTLKVR